MTRPVVPESAEVRQESVERQAWEAELRVFWDADAGTAGCDFENPAHLREWVVRRLIASATDPEGDTDLELPTIADGVSRITGRKPLRR